MSEKKVEFGARQTTLNMISQVAAFVINMVIGFFLTPYIVKHVGAEANGYVQLSSQFISYATLITTAINSMAGRFIAVSYFKNERENVLKYYSSVMFANVFLCLILAIPASLLIAFLPSFINVSDGLATDVRLLFALMFLHFFVDLIGSAWVNSGYVLNRLDMVAMRNTESTILKGLLSLLLFAIFAPHIWYFGLVSFLCTVYKLFRNRQIHKKLMPQVRMSTRYFDVRKVWELLSSGVWNSISSLSSILMGGLDLLIVNLAISEAAMGNVSIAKYLPLYVSSFIITIANVFAPKQTKLFAEDDKEGMKNTLLGSIKITAFLTCLPTTFIIVYGKEFFGLWVPTQDMNLLWKLAIVAVCLYPLSLALSPCSAVISSANKVRTNSLVTLAFSGVSLLTMFIALRCVNNEFLKIIIVIGTSALFSFLQAVTFLLPYCCKIMKCKTRRFYFVLLQSVFAVCLSCAICLGISYLFSANSWIRLIVSGVVVCIIAGLISFFLILGKGERKSVLRVVKKTFKKKNKESK